jgi:hypothetical protein
VIEAGPDTADNTERREDEVGDLRDAEEVPGQGPVQSRENDGEQYLDRARLLEEQRRQSHAAAILCAVRRSGGTAGTVLNPGACVRLADPRQEVRLATISSLAPEKP